MPNKCFGMVRAFRHEPGEELIRVLRPANRILTFPSESLNILQCTLLYHASGNPARTVGTGKILYLRVRDHRLQHHSRAGKRERGRGGGGQRRITGPAPPRPEIRRLPARTHVPRPPRRASRLRDRVCHDRGPGREPRGRPHDQETLSVRADRCPHHRPGERPETHRRRSGVCPLPAGSGRPFSRPPDPEAALEPDLPAALYPARWLGGDVWHHHPQEPGSRCHLLCHGPCGDRKARKPENPHHPDLLRGQHRPPGEPDLRQPARHQDGAPDTRGALERAPSSPSSIVPGLVQTTTSLPRRRSMSSSTTTRRAGTWHRRVCSSISVPGSGRRRAS